MFFGVVSGPAQRLVREAANWATMFHALAAEFGATETLQVGTPRYEQRLEELRRQPAREVDQLLRRSLALELGQAGYRTSTAACAAA